jgi:hypothetical protein
MGGAAMTDKRPFIITICFVAGVFVFLLLWITYVAPGYTEKERLVRNENASMEKDIEEIEAMDGSTKELERKIRDAENRIGEKYASREITVHTASAVIEGICENAGIDEVGIDLGAEKQLSEAGTYIPALYMSEVTILFESTEKRGAAVIRGMENAANADFEVTAFVYRMIPPGEEELDKPEAVAPPAIGEWLITAKIYYYQ